MDELLTQFLVEGTELVAQVHDDLERLAISPADRDTINNAFRGFHTLKGSFAIFAMTPAEQLLHHAENLLDEARREGVGIRESDLAHLVAINDQVDRWMEALATAGALPEDASAVASGLLGDQTAEPEDKAGVEADEPSWFGELLASLPEARLGDKAGALVGFRYRPDAECFFRGDDPVAIAAAVPEIVGLRVLPQDRWPGLGHWDPFRCHALLDGVSTAPLPSVRAALRLVADQVEFFVKAGGNEPDLRPEARPDRSRQLRVDAARLDRLADGVGDLIIAANELSALAEQAEASDPALARAMRGTQARVERVANGLNDAFSAIRHVPLGPLFQRMPRMVREIAAALGKTVHIEIRGSALEADRQIVDGLFEPLLHLVRNAIDHGIEAPDLRAERGKAREGQIMLAAERRGQTITVSVSDDGSGIDADAVRQSAAAKGLLSSEAAAELTDNEALRLIFAPGFSTASNVSEISGRGVGMDAVKTAIERLKGRIDIESRPGEGSRILMRMPLQAITTRLLLVEAGGGVYAIPIEQVVETSRIARHLILPVGQGMACVLRGATRPVFCLGTLVGGEAASSETVRLLISEIGGQRVAFMVDTFRDNMDAIVRERRGILASARGVSGTTLLGENVLLVLDLEELIA